MDNIKLLELGMKPCQHICWTMGSKEGKLIVIMLVQVYMDDIIFGSTKKELCNAFEKLMHEKFQMSSMGELTFFLGLQVFTEVKTTSTQMETQKPFLKDKDGEEVDVHMYRSIIGSLMYLTSSKPDIKFAVCACARYQVNPKVSHLYTVKRIFRNLKGQPKLGLWYLKDSPFDLVAYIDSDYARASLDRKSITGGKAKKSVRLIVGKLFEMELELMLAKTINREQPLHALVDGKKVIITESTVRRDLQLEDEKGVDCLPNATIFEQLALIGPKATAWNEFSSTMASVIICLATNQKFNFSKFIFESMIRNLENVSGKFLMYPRRVGKDFSGRVRPLFLTMVVQNQAELGEVSAIPFDPHHRPTIIKLSSQPQKTQKPRMPKRKDTRVPQPSGPTEHVADEAVRKELGDSLFPRTALGGGPRRQETIGDIIAQTRLENVSKLSNDSLLARGNTLQSDEDRLKINELMELYTTLQKKVLDLEKTKTTQANEIASLKKGVKKLQKKRSSRTHKLKRLYKVGLSTRVESSGDEEDLGEDAFKQGRRINAIDADDDITLVNDDANKEMFDVDSLNGEEVFIAGQNENVVEEIVDVAQVSSAATTVTITTEEITLAQALADLKSTKPKAKGIAFREPGESTTTIFSQQLQDVNTNKLVIHFKKGIAKYAKVSSTHQKCLDLDSSSYFFQKIILL
ncbi:uncharacterized mitochondrial protein-like protein [Tanacetum coccineum]|uniref:Uncharacterized mitochondrial protein-like protein n=1 Tax=Tanacetum coccineum TaxID=301880 RepID=A0ABQ5CCD2_9ASTR